MKVFFTPVTSADLPLLKAWMNLPHWQAWWGNPEDELGRIIEMIEGRDTTRPFLFHIDNNPSGYIQYWLIKDNLTEPYLTDEPWIKLVDDNAIGIDLSIGESKDLSKGYGSKALRQFVLKRKLEGYDTILIDPDPKNQRAIRAYQKAGFESILELDGKDPTTHFNVHLMKFSG